MKQVLFFQNLSKKIMYKFNIIGQIVWMIDWVVLLKYIPDWKNVVAKKYKPWTMRFQGFTGIICSLAKQIQSSFDKSLHCHEILVWMQIPRVLCSRHAVVFSVFFCLPRKPLDSVLWFSSVTVSNMATLFNCKHLMCPAQVKLWAYRHEN